MRDTNIEKNSEDKFVLRDTCPYELEPQIPEGMAIHSKYLGKRCNGRSAWEVNGVVIEAEDVIEANRKYLRQKRVES